MTYKKTIPNPVNLGFKIIKDLKPFEITSEQMKRDEVKGAINQKLIEQVKEVKKAPIKKSKAKED